MEVILKEDIKGLGYKNDIVSVKAGYGRNFLIPQGAAVLANKSTKKVREEDIKQAQHKLEKIKTDAQELGAKLEGAKVEIKTKAGETGKIFGSITPLQISDALKSQGFDVDRKKIGIDNSIKELGSYKADLDLHKEVKVTIDVEIVSE